MSDAYDKAQTALVQWSKYTIEERRAIIRTKGWPHKWVERPVSLKKFVQSKRYLGHPHLSEIQYDLVYETSELFDLEAARADPTQVKFRENQVVEVIAMWGKGCISGNVRLQHIDTGEIRTASEWAASNEDLVVTSLEITDWETRSHRKGKIVASQTDGPVFKKGHGEILRVRTRYGYEIDVYRKHRFLTRDCVQGLQSARWVGADGLSVGDWIATDHSGYSKKHHSDGIYWDRVASIESQGQGDYFDLTVTGTGTYSAHGFWNHNSGKDLCIMVAAARMLYLMGCLTDPHEVFGMPNHMSIDMLNIAVSSDQAEGVFFNPLKRLLRSSSWFMDRLQILIRDTVICAPPIIGYDPSIGDMYGVNFWSGHSSVATMEGKSLLLAVLDEIDGFRVPLSNASNYNVGTDTTAQGMYDAMTTSVQTRFPGIGKVALLSWPRYHGSFIMRRLEEGKKTPHVFASGPYATWEVNPTKIEEQFKVEFSRNPERSRAMLMAMPGRPEQGYFSDTLAVLRVFHAELDDDFCAVRSEVDPGPDSPVDWTRMQLVPQSMNPPDPRALYCWHVDLATKKDRAAAAMAHQAGWMLDEYENWLPVVQLDMVFWWEAPPNGEIDFAEITRFILNFARQGYRTKTVTFDGFQSKYSMQILSKHSQFGYMLSGGGYKDDEFIKGGYLTVDGNTKAYDTLKEVVYDGDRLRAFFCPLLVKEILNLVQVRANKINHPEGSSKDSADAVAGAVYNAVLNLGAVSDVAYRSEKIGQVVIGAQRQDGQSVHEQAISVTGDGLGDVDFEVVSRKAFG